MVGKQENPFRQRQHPLVAAALVVALAGVLFVTPSASQLPPVNCAILGELPASCLKWRSEYDNVMGGDDTAIDIAYGGDKVFVTGTSYVRGPTYYDYRTIAYDADTGAQVWEASFNAAANGDDIAFAVAATSDGSVVVVTGMALWHQSFGHDAFTIGYDGDTGAQLWIARYTLGTNGIDLPRAMVMSPDGSTVYVAVQSAGIDTNTDYATIAYDVQTGGQQWVKRYNGPYWRHDTPRDIAVSPDGSKVFVIGQTYVDPERGYDYGLVSYDAATGAERYVRFYNGPASTVEYGWQVEVSPDGSWVYVTGHSRSATDGGGSDYDYATVAYAAASGTEKWVHRYDFADGQDSARGLAVSPDGLTVFVTGESQGLGQQTDLGYVSPTGWDAATVAIDAATGLQKWAARMDNLGLVSEGGLNTDTGREIAVSPGGTQVYVTGRSMGIAAQEFMVLSYDAVAGTPLWQARLGGDGSYLYDGEATGITVAPDGGVYVTGSVFYQGNSFDWTTVSLRNTGDLGLPL